MKRPKKPTAKRPRPQAGQRDPKSANQRRARTIGPFSAAQVTAAKTYEDRSLVCLRMLARNAWTDANVEALKRAWKCTDAALSNYRRAGKVAVIALNNDDAAKDLAETKAAFQLQANDAEQIAIRLAHERKWTTAAKWRDVQRNALKEFATLAGLVEHRFSFSLEADPRIAGLYQAQLAALDDLDRMIATYVAEVAALTGGVLPKAPLPSAKALVVARVKQYEHEIGARKQLAA